MKSVMINTCSNNSKIVMTTFPIQKAKKHKRQNEESGADKSNKPKAKCPHGVQQPQPSVMEILSPSTAKSSPSVQEKLLWQCVLSLSQPYHHWLQSTQKNRPLNFSISQRITSIALQLMLNLANSISVHSVESIMYGRIEIILSQLVGRNNTKQARHISRPSLGRKRGRGLRQKMRLTTLVCLNLNGTF